MPVLNWIGKEAVVKHHKEVPFRLLEPVPALSCGDPESENLIVEGDNLHALKALLPRYAGQVKCIYIDPPYNTGNEGWAYNDNVNSPEIRKWLGEVVGKEGETLDRHDRWLCMMYPRLVLLKQFLRDDGVILVSLDGNEQRYAELLMDEVFGSSNRIETFIWKKSYGGGAKSKQVVNLHEFVLCFARKKENIGVIELPPTEAVKRYYKFRDEKFEFRGPYRLQPLATNSMDARPNLRYAIPFEGEEIWPEKQWQWSSERALAALANDELVIKKIRGRWSVNYKQYLRDDDGDERGSKLYSIVDGIYTQQGTNELKAMFGDGKAFDFPKPPELVKKFLQAFTDQDSVVLDSFAGSGTTAQALLGANADDGGNRRFILVEMDGAIAKDVTAERVRRVSQGYTNSKGQKVEGLGGGFQYCRLSVEPLFEAGGPIRKDVTFEQLAEFVWFIETGTGFPKTGGGVRNEDGRQVAEARSVARVLTAASPFLGMYKDRAVFLLYNGILKDRSDVGGNVLNSRTLEMLKSELSEFDCQLIVYGARSRFDKSKLAKLGITFHQLPYDLATKTWF